MKKLMVMIPIGIGAIALVTFVGGQLVMRLWNWLLPPLLGVPEVTFWQAVGLLALSRILFGGMGMGGRGGHSKHEHFTPEERERFRQRMRDRFGSDPKPAEAPPAT
jgi:hypothetical protein